MPKQGVAAGYDLSCMDYSSAVCTAVPTTEERLCGLTYEGVKDPTYFEMRKKRPPTRAHRFCFSCGAKGGHWPASCSMMESWKDQIRKETGTQDDDDSPEDFNDVAHKLWIKANTRSCPKCNVPIEKNEGCNHLTCTNRHCRHEFCWICRKDWKLHNTDTGGFYRCNRWQEENNHQFYDAPPQAPVPVPPGEDAPPDELTYGTAAHAGRVARKNSREMARFIHHYQRWRAHKESAMLETNMAMTAHRRLEPVIKEAIEFSMVDTFNFDGRGLSFIHSAFTELLECRSVLQHTYAFAFKRYPKSYDDRPSYRRPSRREREKNMFEQLQSELEMLTEQMSDVVARAHLRATQNQIIYLTNGAADKRSELNHFMICIYNREFKKKRQAERDAERNSVASAVDPLDAATSTQPRYESQSVSGGRHEFRDLLRRSHHRRGGSDSSSSYADIDFGSYPYSLGLQDIPQIGMESLLRRGDDDGSSDDDGNQADRRRWYVEALVRNSFEEDMRRALESSLRESTTATATAAATTTAGATTTTTHQAAEEIPEDEASEVDRWIDWSCPACTFNNSGGISCVMCGSLRSE